MSSEPIPANPSNGNNANIGQGSILRDKTIGCLATSSQVTTSSSMHGFPLKGTSWSSERRQQTTPLLKTTGERETQGKSQISQPVDRKSSRSIMGQPRCA